MASDHEWPSDIHNDAPSGDPVSPASEPVVVAALDPTALDRAARVIAAGGVVAFPTDTVYGIGASLSHADALHRIYTIKGRPEDKPLPVLLASADALAAVAPDLDLDPRLARLAARYWPGPLTIAVPARPGLPPEVLGPGDTVGARVPDHPLALALIARAGGALATTSANLSGQPPARTAAEVVRQLGARLDLVLDGGPTPGGTPSTVVAVRAGQISILRDGAIPGANVMHEWVVGSG